ncbi:uncharacterized protein EI90DRAFT_3041419 [Cantharellus anzutake]|uniref:uncharacterized protein n=1 Tax=Cantharellus anzutake TaxID=1750568 RepID=UPI001904239B|nr:uncharacterized protein EI90DRAFT_3041419 [Cantharellus anzutake]KAF8338048.1 hypothetical protein EI90DRAFT_3041419 [Cantharellus anzutake]
MMKVFGVLVVFSLFFILVSSFGFLMHSMFSFSFDLYLGAGVVLIPPLSVSEKIGPISLPNTTTQKHDELRAPFIFPSPQAFQLP